MSPRSCRRGSCATAAASAGNSATATLSREALGDFQPLHRMHPGELFRDDARLVGLHAPYEVPRQRQFPQRRLFSERFLQVTLAKMTQAAARRVRERLRGLGLADGQDCDRLRTPSGRRDRLPHLSEHCIDTLGQILRTH
jgi:hypothetical protein